MATTGQNYMDPPHENGSAHSHGAEVPRGSAGVAADLENSLPPQLEDVRRRLQDANERALEFVRERPIACLVGAVAFGFVVGKMASRYS